MFRFLQLVMLTALSTALLGSDCGDAEAMSLEELRKDVPPAFDYTLYCDAQGTLVGKPSAVLLVHRSTHLEQVYADAVAGDTRARNLFRQLEDTIRRTGVELADRALGFKCSTAPACALQWHALDELIPSRQPGGERLRQLLVESFSREAKLKGVRNAVLNGALSVLLAGTVLKASAAGVAEAEAGTAEARAGAAEAGRLALPEIEGRLAEKEVAAALETRLAEAEGQAFGARHPIRLEALERYRPSRAQPPTGVEANHPRWTSYTEYWERRYEELAGRRPLPPGRTQLKPPLTWDNYTALLGRFQRALEFQRSVTRVLQLEAQQAGGQRMWLRGLERPLVAENVGLAHEGRAFPTYADQFIVDEATLSPGMKPSVHTFSTKQHDFSGMSIRDARSQLIADIQEAQAKYGGAVEVRRLGHPLLGRKVIVSRVHLVYDGTTLSEEIRGPLALEATRRGVELHFYAP